MGKLDIRIPRGAVPRHLELVAHESHGENHLDLVGGKEPPRAGMPAVAKRQAVLADADELVLGRGLDGAPVPGLLPEVVEAQGIELIGSGEDGRVRVDGDDMENKGV